MKMNQAQRASARLFSIEEREGMKPDANGITGVVVAFVHSF